MVGDQPLHVGQLQFEVGGGDEIVRPRLGDLARGGGEGGAISPAKLRRGRDVEVRELA
jgi:hypothetical protein